MERKVHARNRDTKELLCGKKIVPATDFITERWDSNGAKEITCSECHANIHRFTAEELEAGIDEALEHLLASS
jgi:hypothetical protein